MLYRVVLIFILLIGLQSVSSQEQQKSDSLKIRLGGPNQVENQLEEDKQPKQTVFDLGFLAPYFDFKETLNTDAGFDFGIDYSAAYLGASESLGSKQASSGMVRFYSSWELVNRGQKNSGSFIFKVEHRHAYTDVVPKGFGFEIGYAGLEIPAFNQDGFRMTNFYWRQRFKQGKWALVAGLLDATDYVDAYIFASPWTGFLNFQFSTGSESVYIPNDAALGIGIGGYISDHVYAIASISDAGSDPTSPFKSFETFFSNNDYFKSVEIGYVSSQEEFFLNNVHLTYWHSDGSEVTASLPGWGVAFSAIHHFSSGIHPFIRGGFAEDGGTILQKSVTAGFGFQKNSGGSLLGLGVGWGEPNETTFAPGLKDQWTTELFYRIQFSPKFAVTPDLQWILNPALNPNTSSVFVWGFRGRLAI